MFMVSEFLLGLLKNWINHIHYPRVTFVTESLICLGLSSYATSLRQVKLFFILKSKFFIKEIKVLLWGGCFLFSCAIFAGMDVVANGMPNNALITPGNHAMLNALGIKNSAQTISFADNEQISVVLSSSDINRLVVQGDKIQNINAPLSLYNAKNDAGGAAYITLLSTLPFTMYLTTVGGHNFSLFVNPRPIVGKSVIFQPTSTFAVTKPWEENSNYQKILVTLVKNMVNHQTPDGYLYREAGKVKSSDFCSIANLKPLAFYSSSQLTGIIFELKNKKKKPITLHPADFYRPGVRAVALSQQVVNPAATVFLYEVISYEDKLKSL